MTLCLLVPHRWTVPATLGILLLVGAAHGSSFVEFEAGQVRPLALSPDGTALFVVDTPDDRLELFTVDPITGNLTHAYGNLTQPYTATVSVGLEPVAVAARTNTEVWVVNHLSDSVSIVQLDPAGVTPPRVVRTLLVGDEPRDIVFAGPGRALAFITTAHRGQNSPVPISDLTTSGIGRADVWVFDANNLGTALGGTPLTVITLFGDTPRALAVSPDGSTVYAAAFHSGNQTATLSEGVVCDGGSSVGPCTVAGVTYPGGLPAPNRSADGVLGGETGLIVKFNQADGHWEDVLGRNWDNGVRFSLPDDDVFQIDATQSPPIAKPSPPHDGQPFPHVGTILFNVAVNPVSGHIYVTNGDSPNDVRFDGQRSPCGAPTSVVGHLSEARIAVLDPATGSVTPRRLNAIDYCTVPSPAGTAADSLATPLGMAITSDGSTLYVAAFGSSDPARPGTTGKVGVFATAQLEAGTFTPSAANHIVLSGGGASGVVLKEVAHRLYVLTRFDDAVSVVDTSTFPGIEVQHLPVYNPESPSVVAGRPFLYDAGLTSSNGEAACASCHPFAEFDSLAWDLGNPGDVMVPDPNLFSGSPGLFTLGHGFFHPLKGPMTTQTLRGLAHDGPMHWRGDRTPGTDPRTDPNYEAGAFEKFNVAFVGLNGMPGHCGVTSGQSCHGDTDCPVGQACVGLSDADMQSFTDFVLQIAPPPNPIRALDHSFTPDQLAGFNVFDGSGTCLFCHRDSGNTAGFEVFDSEPQNFKIPPLRHLYSKVGMFGMPAVQLFLSGNNGFLGDQVRGVGFLHDGSVDTIFRFHGEIIFNVTKTQRAQLEQFVLAIDGTFAPIVGQQITLDSTNSAIVGPRIDLLLARARASFRLQPECDVVVKGTLAGLARGWVRTAAGMFQSDRAAEALLTDAQLRALAAISGQELTYACVPPGSGVRIGIDRDGDGHFDRDELDAGTDPTDPNSPPPSPPPPPPPAPELLTAKTLSIKNALPANESKNGITLKSADSGIAIPTPGSADDPRCGSSPSGTVRAVLIVANNLSGQAYETALPCQHWALMGTVTSPTGYSYSDATLVDSTVKRLTWKRGKALTAILSGRGPAVLNYSVGLPPQGGAVDVEVRSGGTRLCWRCGGVVTADGTNGKLFHATRCPAPTACAVLGFPSGAFVDAQDLER